MRVLIVSNMYPSDDKPYSGIFVRNQYRALAEAEPGATVEICALKRKMTGRVGSAIKYFVFMIRLLPSLFRRYDVVHVHYLVPLVLFAALYKKCHPASLVVVTMHGTDVMGVDFNSPGGKLWSHSTRGLDCGICVGPDIKERAERELAFQKVIQLPAGVDTEVFSPGDYKQKTVDFCYIGSLFDYKGTGLVADYLEQQVHPNQTWHVVGDGPLRPRFEKLAEKGVITYQRSLPQRDIAALIHRSKWVVSPSQREAFGLVPVESIYSGTPVIVTAIPAFRWTVSEGQTGLFCQPGSLESLADSIDLATNMDAEEYRKMVKSCRESKREYSLSAVAGTLWRLYRGD